MLNHSRLKYLIKLNSGDEFHISSKYISLIEKYLVNELNIIIKSGLNIMKLIGRKTLYVKDLQLDKRFNEIGNQKSFSKNEITLLIKNNSGEEVRIQANVEQYLKGFLIEKLNDVVQKSIKIARHHNKKKLMPIHLEPYLYELME